MLDKPATHSYTLNIMIHAHAQPWFKSLYVVAAEVLRFFFLKPNGVFATMFTSLKHVINNANRVSSACLGSVPTSERASEEENHSLP